MCIDLNNLPTSSANTMTRRLKKYNPNFTTHIFRHYHISYLSEKTVPIKAVMDRVRHSDPQTTLKIYSHTTRDMIDYINKSTAELF
ncbi:tyrosine-type recombinase/integrase [Streptococcus sp. 32226D021BW]